MKKVLISLCFLGFGQVAMSDESCQGRQAVDQDWAYQKQFGGQRFAAGVAAGVSFQARCDFLQAQAASDANVVVFGESLAIGQAYLSASWRNTNERTLSSRVSLLGFELDSQELRADYPLQFASNSRHDFDEEGDVSFSVGPFSIPVRYGAAGSADYQLTAKVDGLNVRADVQPQVETRAYTQLGVSVPFVEVALRGNVLVLQDELLVTAGTSLVEGPSDVLLYFDASLRNRLRALDGYITASAKTGFFGKREFEEDVFSWAGYELDEFVVAIDDFTRL
ncbi:MAG: hypothetical protein ACOH5I_23980 [Oligoflexus sp.]